MKKVAPPPPALVKQPLSNGSVQGRRSSSGDRQPPLSTTPGEDSAFDESLEGRMEIEVVLPDLKVVRMTVDRRTPMMDLLVHATTSNRISPGGHIINVISKDERNVPYKPNTPIGSLDANTVYIIPKSTLELPIKRMPKLANQPFEQTFRLQVNLPQNQRMVLRVSPRITLAELKNQICSEKELDHSSHHLVHPAQPDTILDLNATLEVYGCAEISLMSNSGLRDSIQRTSTNIFPIPKIEEERKKKGILRLFSRKKKDFQIETTNGSNGLPTSHSENSLLNRNSYQPKQSIKRKPAPAPPPTLSSSPPLITQSSNSINSRPESEISVKTADEIEGSISHSRHSSDSSGYHEPSVFSDCSENKSPEASIVHGDSVSVNDATRHSPLHKEYPESSAQLKRSSMTTKDTNLKNAPSCSNVSIISASRKRKAPLPPVSTLPAIESPSSPDPPGSANPVSTLQSNRNETPCAVGEPETNCSQKTDGPGVEGNGPAMKDSVQQESEALQYLEEVLQESENCNRNFSSQRMLDDSDTDSLKDEGEMISICQAEIHANDQDSSDSVVEPLTVVTPDPSALPKSNLAPLSALNSQPERREDSFDTKFVPSSDEFHVQDVTVNTSSEKSQDSFNSTSEKCSEGENSGLDSAITAKESSPDKVHTVPNKQDSTTVDVSAKTVDASTKVVDVPTEIVDVPTEIVDVPTEIVDVPTKVEVSSIQPSPPKSGADETKNDNCDKISMTSSLSLESPRDSVTHTPQLQKKLDNFAMGCYRKETDIDIYSIPSPEDKPLNNIVNGSNVGKEIEAPSRKKRNQPDVKIVSFQERNLKDSGVSASKGNVSEKCAQLSNTSTLPLTGRSTSLFNLTPQKKLQLQRATTTIEDEELVNGSMKRTHSDQNLAKDLETVEMKDTFLQEQKRLQEEYRRLQEQFISWQKQLLSNQNLLQSEKIVPQMPFPSLEGLTSLDSNIPAMVSYENKVKQKSDTNINYNDFKTRSLPRPKTKPLSVKEPSRPTTPPLSQTGTDTSVVDIDINTDVPAKRPESFTCSVDTQVSFNQEDKIVQVPPPQDKDTQVPSPQEKVTSGTQVPSPETILNKDTSAQTSEVIQTSSSDISGDSLSSPESDNSKSRTLPRPKPKPISALQPSQTMTLNRNSRPKSQAVSVTIGSWHQRQTHASDIETSSNVASTRSKFLSMDNISQESVKPLYSTIEKRKLPPVPTETSVKTLPKTVVKSSEPKASAVKASIRTKSIDESKADVVDKKATSKSQPASDTRATKTVPKQVEDTITKQKSEIRLASREPTATFKLAKPFVKMSSMKDETHTPSIIGLRKWPLSEISESHTMTDGKQTILDDLKASSKRPGGYVQDKIRRAEVDLRKPKSSKHEATTVPKSIDDSNEASKLHITKVTVNNTKLSAEAHAPNPKPSSKEIVSAPVTRSNTLPKSQSLNSELLSVFSKKASKNVVEKSKDETAVKLKNSATITVNGSVQSATPPPPPPPPPLPQASTSSAMPTIPPAEQIPVSSRLLMARETKTLPTTSKESKKKSPTKVSRTSDPREELMLEIRGFGGKKALRKAPAQTGWNLKVFGTVNTANT